MTNFKLTFTFDGYRFFDVVAADSIESAKAFFLHETAEGHDSKVVAVEATEEAPTYVAGNYTYTPCAYQRYTDREEILRYFEEKSDNLFDMLFGE